MMTLVLCLEVVNEAHRYSQMHCHYTPEHSDGIRAVRNFISITPPTYRPPDFNQQM